MPLLVLGCALALPGVAGARPSQVRAHRTATATATATSGRPSTGVGKTAGRARAGSSTARRGPRESEHGREPAPALGELVPERCRFFMQVDADALRQAGPAAAVGRFLHAVAPALNELGVSVDRVRGAVMASSLDEPRSLSGEQLPSWLLLQQRGGGPDRDKLERALLGVSRGPWRSVRGPGLSYRKSRDASVVELPGGTMLVTGGAHAVGPVIQRLHGQGAGFLASERASLLREVPGSTPGGSGEGAARPLALWMELTPGMRRSLSEDLHAPVVPGEVAAVLRAASGTGAEAVAVARLGDAEQAQALSGWVRDRLKAAEQQLELQLLGLTGYAKAAQVTADGRLVSVRLALGETEYASLLERLTGVLGSLGARAASRP